jgi:hypothetical protein
VLVLRESGPEVGVSGGEEGVFTGVPAQEMGRLLVARVVIAAGPDFVQEKCSRAVGGAIEIVGEAAFFFARGRDKGA